MRATFGFLLFLTLTAGLAPADDTGVVPPIPDSIPSNAVKYTVLSAGNPAGNLLVWTTADGSRHSFYQYNDRGRGPKIETVMTVGPDGLPTSIENIGVDYLKGPVQERFSIRDGSMAHMDDASLGRIAQHAVRIHRPPRGSPVLRWTKERRHS